MPVLPVIFPGDMNFENEVRSGSCVWGGQVEAELDPVRKYDPNQPRDERGRWTDTGLTGNLAGYTAAPAASASELYQRTLDPNVTPDDIIDAVPGAREKIEKAEADLAQELDTQQLYKDPATGRYTPEREAVHEQILADVFTQEAIERAKPMGDRPTFVVLGGRAGAGKSFFTRSNSSPVDADGFLVINSDDFKAALPEYKGWNASSVHEESSDIVNDAHNIARSSGLNVVFDATLRSSATASRLVDEYRAAGYRIEGYFMHTAPQVSAYRAVTRFMGPEGRYVPPAYVLGSNTNERVFDSLTSKMDNWAVYDNNAGSGPALVVKKE